MRHIFAAAIVIAASTAYALAGSQSGKPRYFVKAWLQETDKSFEHTTGWCDDSYRCLVPIGEHMIELRDVSGSSYLLSFRSEQSEESPCCVFRDGFPRRASQERLPSRRPSLLHTRDMGRRRRQAFGKLIIVVEDLHKPNQAPETSGL